VPLETMEKIQTFVENGLTVVALRLPVEVPTFKDHDAQTSRLRQIVAALFPDEPGTTPRRIGKGAAHRAGKDSLSSIFENLSVEPQLTVNGQLQVRWLHRQGTDYDLFLLHNPSPENSLRQKFSFRAKGCLEIWNAHSGKIEPCPYRVEGARVVADIEIGPKESRLGIIRRDKPATGLATNPKRDAITVANIEGPWSVIFQHMDGRKPFEQSFAKLIDWTGIDDLKHFAGTAIYRTQFRLPSVPPGKMVLDPGKVCDVASVAVNGKTAGTVFESPYRVDVTGFVHAGENEILVNVANRAENAIADAATDWKGPGKWPGYFFVNRAYKEYDPSQAQTHPSGLLGPVRLLTD
jgi:hypothetical protein